MPKMCAPKEAFSSGSKIGLNDVNLSGLHVPIVARSAEKSVVVSKLESVRSCAT